MIDKVGFDNLFNQEGIGDAVRDLSMTSRRFECLFFFKHIFFCDVIRYFCSSL